MTDDNRGATVSTKEVIELCDRLLSQGAEKRKHLNLLRRRCSTRKKTTAKVGTINNVVR